MPQTLAQKILQAHTDDVIERDGQIMYPVLDTRMEDGDSVILFSNAKMESEVVRIFGKGVLPEM